MNSESMISQTGRQMDYCTQYASILRAQQRFVNFCSNLYKIGVQSQLRHFKRLLTHSFVSGKKSAVIIFRLEPDIQLVDDENDPLPQFKTEKKHLRQSPKNLARKKKFKPQFSTIII